MTSLVGRETRPIVQATRCDEHVCLSGCQDVNEAIDGGVLGRQWHWTICKQSEPHSRQITTPAPHQSIGTGQILFLTPNQQCQSTEGWWLHVCQISAGSVYPVASVNLLQRRLLPSALTDALLRLFGTHYRKLSSTVTLLLCLSLG